MCVSVCVFDGLRCAALRSNAGPPCMALSTVGPSVAHNNDLSETQASENADNPQRLSDKMNSNRSQSETPETPEEYNVFCWPLIKPDMGGGG